MKTNKLKFAFGFFFGVVAASLSLGVTFLESERFAGMAKKFIRDRSPDTLGITADFSNLKLYFFPPGVGVSNAKVSVLRNNVSKQPIEAEIEAKELRMNFEPIQMLSGTLQASKVLIHEGYLRGVVGADVFKPKPVKKKTAPLSWQELLELQINSVEFENTLLDVAVESPKNPAQKIHTELVVKHLEAYKVKKDNKGVFRSSALVNAVKFDIPKSIAEFPVKMATELEWDLSLTDEGILFDQLRVQLQGLEFTTKGKLKGNVLDEGNPLQFELDGKLKSDLETFFYANEISDEVSGSVQAEMNVRGDLSDIVKTMKGSYRINGQKLKWKDATVAKLEGEGELDLRKKEVSVKKISLYEKENIETGGEIEVSDGVIPFGSILDGMKARVRLKKAPLLWAGGAIIDAIYPLRADLNGSVDINANRGRLELKPDLEIKGFQFTNQKYKVSRPMFYILKPRETLKVKGLMVTKAGSGKLDFQQMLVSMKNTHYEANGSISPKDGFDLRVKGNLDLAEMGEIAEIPIRGTGTLATHIHGDTNGVIIDFDPVLKNAEYVNLHIGDLDGRITYDQLADELRFTKIHAKNEKTFYSLSEGFVDLSNAAEIRLPFTIHNGRIEDLNRILEHYTKKISWYPNELNGEIHGTVGISGKTSFPEMAIEGKIEGADWKYFGERSRKIRMEVGYNRGTYYARDVVLYKTSGNINGMLDFDSKKDQLTWSFKTEQFSLNDIDFINRLELPARSKIDVTSTGTGKLGNLVSSTKGRFFQTMVKGEVLDPTSFSLDLSESTLRANLEVFGSRLKAGLKYSLTPKQPSNLNVDFTNLDFTPLILILNPKLLDDPNLLGQIDGHFKFDFLSTQSELSKGEILLRKYVLRKTGFQLNLVEPVQTNVQLGYFQINPAQIKSNSSLMTLSGSGKMGEVDLKLKGDLDLGVAEIFSSTIQKVNGEGQIDLRITGPLKDLRFNGDLDFSNAYCLMRWLQTPFEEIDGRLKIRQNTINVESVDGYLGEHKFALKGKIETYSDRFPVIDLKAQLEDNKVKMEPLDLVQVRGNAFIRGDHPPYVISGALDVVQALWAKSFGKSSSASASSTERYAPKDFEKQVNGNLFTLDLQVNAPQGFMVRNEVLDGEFRGKVKLSGAPDHPNLMGEGQLIQGKVLFRDRPFILETVKVIFDDPYGMNPKFNAAAVSEINQYKIRVLAFGKSSSWKAEFSSTPYLPQNDIFSLLASGTTSADASRFRSRDRSYVNQGEAASLVLHSLDFGKDVQSKTGFQFDVEEAIDQQSATSIFRPQNRSDNVAAPKLVLKRQVGRKVGIAFGSTVGVGNQVQREVNAEYKLNNSVSLMGVWNNIEETNTRETRTSFGLDLKLNKRFK